MFQILGAEIGKTIEPKSMYRFMLLSIQRELKTDCASYINWPTCLVAIIVTV